MNDERYLKLDRLRFTKNTASSRLAYLAILFDVLFFVSIYQSDVGTYYYTILIGASVLYNLIFLLLTFLSSEGVKNYKKSYSWLLIALGVIQVARIFIYPMNAHAATVKVNREMIAVMSDSQFIYAVLCLSASAVCCVVSAIVNLFKSSALAQHIASLNGQKA